MKKIILFAMLFLASCDYTDDDNFDYATEKFIEATDGFIRNIGNSDSMCFYESRMEVFLELQCRYNHHGKHKQNKN